MSWAISVIAPWCLGMGLLVSITADAGQNATIGGSFAVLDSRAPPQPTDLIPAETVALTGDVGGFGIAGDPLVKPVSFDLGQPADFAAVDDEIEPRGDLKPGPSSRPEIDRTHKGNPALGLRPTFDTQLRRPGGTTTFAMSQMIGPHDDAMPAGGFSLQDAGGPLDGAVAFSPWGEGEDPQDATDDQVRAARAVIAMRPAALKQRLAQGATPKVARADALSSTTPAPPDGTPIEVSFSPSQLQAPNVSIVTRSDGHPNYAALLVGDHGARERKCLAEAVYFEARSEPEEGQAAVAQVVLNRATSGLYPASICGVVYQNRTHYKACQFSFACEGKSLRVNEPDAWSTAVRIANEVVDGKTYLSDVGGATHYHANYVRPGWARRLVKMDVIGHHIFYKLRAGQS
jgi:spore germination cell wall hydrolase CwlJ-like protein